MRCDAQKKIETGGGGDKKASFLIVEKIAQNASHLLLFPPNAELRWRQARAALTFSSFLRRSFSLETRPLSALLHTCTHKVCIHGLLLVGHFE